MMSDWSLPLAIATGSLAAAAFWAIRQTRDTQKSEKRERLLNEIIEWAIDVAGCGSDINIPFFPEVSELSKEEQARERITEGATRASLGNLLLRYKVIVVRREYVKNIALFMGEDLLKKEGEVANNLSKVVDLLEKRIKGKATTEMVTEAEKSLNECARILIKEAAKIKTKDIGKKEHMSKKEETTGSNKTTLENIEDHLKRQDKRMKRGEWGDYGAIGFTTMLVSVSLWIARGDLSLAALFFSEGYGVLFVIGSGIAFFAWFKQRKIKD